MKIKTKIVGLALIAIISAINSNAQQIRNVGDFTGIKAGDSFNIVISSGETNSVKIDADDKIQPQIKTEVKDGILNISIDGTIKTDKPIVINLGIKSITSIDVSGSADLKNEGQLTCDKLTIESSGAGDVRLNVKANEIKTQISGAGDVTLKGTSQVLDASVSGAGDLKASDLEVDKAKIKASGAGDAKVFVKQNLDADVSGAGSIIYKGNPAERNVSISGSGSVRESKIGTGEETASDTTKFKLGDKRFLMYGDKKHNNHNGWNFDADSSADFKHWRGFEFGLPGYVDYKNSLDVPEGSKFLELDYSKSIQFGLNLIEKNIHLYKNHLNLVTGIGFDFTHYAFQNNITLNGDTTYLSASDDAVNYKKNTLNVSYVKVPLILEYNTNTNPSKNFHFAVGAEFKSRIHSVAKQQFNIDDTHYKTKRRDDFNLSPFQCDLVARIGYNDVTIFGSYGVNRLFKKDKAAQVYPFAVGVTINI